MNESKYTLAGVKYLRRLFPGILLVEAATLARTGYIMKILEEEWSLGAMRDVFQWGLFQEGDGPIRIGWFRPAEWERLNRHPNFKAAWHPQWDHASAVGIGQLVELGEFAQFHTIKNLQANKAA